MLGFLNGPHDGIDKSAIIANETTNPMAANLRPLSSSGLKEVSKSSSTSSSGKNSFSLGSINLSFTKATMKVIKNVKKNINIELASRLRGS